MILRQSTVVAFLVGPILDADGVAVEAGPTIDDIRLTKAGVVSAAAAAATLVHNHAGMWLLTTIAANTNTVGTLQVSLNDGVNAMKVVEFHVVEEAIFDALYAASAAGFDANQRVNLGLWLGTAPLALSSQQVQSIVPDTQKVDLNTVKTQAVTAAAGVTFYAGVGLNATGQAAWEDQYDGTGIAGGNFPATQSQVNNIGSGATGGTHVEATYDNTTRDTIDNAGANLLGGGLVGIPVTGHTFVVGREVTIAGSIAYNGAFDIVSQTANEVVITHAQTAEAFTGAETIVSSIKGEIFVGTVTGGTFADTSAENGVLHSVDDDGDDINIVYGFNIGGSRQASAVAIFANVDGNTDEITVKAYNFVADEFELKGAISGSGGTSFVPLDSEFVSRNTGTGAEIGDVFVLFDTVTTSPSSLDVDKCLITAVGTNLLIGYPNGYEISAAGTSGTEYGVNGTAGNPCPFADALTMNAIHPLNLFTIHNGEAIELSGNSDGLSLAGEAWTLDLSDESIAGSFIQGATLSGTATGAGYTLEACAIGVVTMAPGTHRHCIYADATTGFTMGSAGTYFINDPRSGVAGNTAPVFTWDGSGTSKGNFRAISMGVQFEAMAAGDIATVEGLGQFVEGTCPGGAVTIRGNLTLSGISNIAITDEARFSVDQITGGAWALDTDSNGRIRIVDGAGVGEINTNDGAIVSVTTTDTATALGADSVNTTSVQDGTITAAKIGADAITNAKIADDAIAAENLKTGAFTADAFAANALVDATFAASYYTTIALINDIALQAINLDHLMKTAVVSNADMTAEVSDGSVLSNLMSKTSDTSTYVVADDSLEAISDQGGTTPTVGEIEDAVWDASKNDHKTKNTMGYLQARSGGGEEVTIRSATAQAGGDATITLDTGASTTNNVYRGNTISLVGGTGNGQTRKIVVYNGGTKIAVVDKTWVVNPDVTSDFNIIAFTGSVISDEGVAQAGTSDSITLASTASADDDIYNRSFVTITAGTGAGQTRTITDYDGLSKVADVDVPWAVAPDDTSVYAVTPSGADVSDSGSGTGGISAAEAATAVWTDDLSLYVGVGTTGKAVADILGDTGELQANQGDWATADVSALALETTIDALNNVSPADVLEQVNAALDTAISELGVAQPAATPSLRTGLMLQYMALRNQLITQTSGVDALEIYNDAGVKIAKKLLTDDGSDYTEDQMESG